MHINYRGQFGDKQAAKACKRTAGRNDTAQADEDRELLDLDEEEEPGQHSGRSR